jgi:hypothetical protein
MIWHRCDLKLPSLLGRLLRTGSDHVRSGAESLALP